MALEIERRFLVDARKLPKKLPAGDDLVQGFLSFDPVVRVRIKRSRRSGKKRAFLTIKGRGLRVREEFEYGIPLLDAKRLLRLCGKNKIEKIRRCIGPWELDAYRGPFKGLWTVEIELDREHAKLPDPLPPWVQKEVTEDPRYTNARLVKAGKPLTSALKVCGAPSRKKTRGSK